MTRPDRSPLRYAWLTILGLLLVGVAVTVGLVILSSGGAPGESPTASPGADPGRERPGGGFGGEDPGGNPDTGRTTPPGVGRDPPDFRAEVDALHAQGITGENVSVGVVDVTGFDTGDEAIRGQVRAARSFGTDGGIHDGGPTAHGTAAASIVTRVAPDADLYLANFDSPEGFRQAIAWLLRQDVDVIVAPVSFYGQADDGSAAVSRAATRASERGVVFVAPVGNLAQGHWGGEYGTDVEDGDLARVQGDDRRFALWLSWDRAHADENYTAVLHRWNGSTSEVVARSQPYREDEAPNERIVTTLDPGRYFVTVHGPNRSTGATLEVTSPTHRLGRGSPAGSMAAPATARRVIAVGAHDADGEVAAFSSRGPTDDGRPGVDVVAPGRYRAGNETRLVGSSAAAPYVAGVAALIRSVDPAVPPPGVEAALEMAASDVGRPGYDYAAGYGRVNPARAVAIATGEPVAGTTNATDADPGVDSGGVERHSGENQRQRRLITGLRPVKSGFDRK